MAIFAVVALVFGWMAGTAFTAAPFVAGNVILAVAVIVLGLLNGFSLGAIVLRVVVASAALQAGFLLRLMRDVRGDTREQAVIIEERRSAEARGNKSTIDGSR